MSLFSEVMYRFQPYKNNVCDFSVISHFNQITRVNDRSERMLGQRTTSRQVEYITPKYRN